MKKIRCENPFTFFKWVGEYEDGPGYEITGQTYASEHKENDGIIHFVTTYINDELFQYRVEGAKSLEEAVQFAREE